MKFYIETERLILRELQNVDLQAWFEMESDPVVHKYLGNNPLKEMKQIEDAFKSILQQYAENGIGRWATIEKSTGNFIGWSGLKFIKEYEKNQINFYDVGYRLNKKYWGMGYATDSCKAALEYGFSKMNLHEIIGVANEENKASLRILEKCGLTFVEKFVWKDIKSDWLKITKYEYSNLINQTK